jgi:hypothetical protein
MLRSVFVVFVVLALTTCTGVWTDFNVKSYPGGEHHLTKKLININVKNQTKQEVLKALGEPQNKIKIDATNERWIYPYKAAWKGIYLIVIFPIPLKAPLGHLNVFVDFEGERANKISYEELSGSLYACGVGFLLMTATTHGYEAMLCGKMD